MKKQKPTKQKGRLVLNDQPHQTHQTDQIDLATFLKKDDPEICITQDTITNTSNTTIPQYSNTNNTQYTIHISGAESTSEIGSSSKTPLARTAKSYVSNEKFYGDADQVLDYYKKYGKTLRDSNFDPYYIAVSVKGHKSHGQRREVNIEIIPEPGAAPIHLKSHTVQRTLKWELFRDLPEAEQTSATWQCVDYLFKNCDYSAYPKAGKIKTRRRYNTVPRGRLEHCVCTTEDYGHEVHVNLMFGENMYTIIALPVKAEFFTHKGDRYNNKADADEVLL